MTWSPGKHVVKFGINIPDWSWRGLDDRTNTGGTFYFSSLDDFAAGRPFSFIAQHCSVDIAHLTPAGWKRTGGICPYVHDRQGMGKLEGEERPWRLKSRLRRREVHLRGLPNSESAQVDFAPL